ncbi:MAG: long-chain fatty acid--CoA ligase [Bacteroidales bacterium]|nr:MAG: long-chain fatty acid--CoA ligase [Bacteroidales bacterium]
MKATRTFDILERGIEIYNGRTVLAGKQNGGWIEYDIHAYIENSNYLSYGLLALGLNKGDKVATVSNNRPEWNFVDMAVSQTGMIHVPIYSTISNEEYKHILSHSESRIIFVENKALYERLQPIAAEIPNIIGIYTFVKSDGINFWEDIANNGKNKANHYKEELIKIKESVKPNDIATLIYTSGTTGLSKGVMLSHENILSNVIATSPRLPLAAGDKTLSFLPLCHVLERMVIYIYQYTGMTIYFAESMATIGDNIRELNINAFCAVPRVLEAVYDKIIAKGKDLSGIKKHIFFWAVNLGLRYEFDNKNGWVYDIQLKLARKLIFSKWQAALGGNLKLIISGGAALQPRLARVFWAAGIPVLEGYGLTETSPVISVNHFQEPNSVKFGSVGPILENVTVVIADDGEILMKGPNLMLGYFKDDELTKQAIDENGWFHTGDIGRIDDNRFLVITDRKKEIFKMSSGKYIAPQVIENKVKESFFIEQTMIVGENEKFVSALISPNFSFLHDWCSRHKIHFVNNKDLISLPEVIARYQKEINAINKQLGEFEQIKRFRIVEETWSSQTGELSPTLKLRRKILYDRYEPILEEIFGHAMEK